MAERALRGSRLGAVSYENEQATELAERQMVAYNCPNGHHIEVPFAAEAEVPQTWECRFCGATALKADAATPEPTRIKAPRSHWDMLLERRSIPELEAILAERLELLRVAGRRKSA
jgi:thioesterase domain-containing protein